jgi:multimeric flavodoxin WrbA
MRILFINGSHRQGNTDIALKKILSFIHKSHEVKILKLREIEMKLPDGCTESANSNMCIHVEDEFSNKIEPTLHDFDIYIIVSPTWDDHVTPLTKIFWDRIVHWCHPDRMYLKNKKLAVITHGMADQTSWDGVINWVKGICVWEKANFGGSLSFSSGGKINTITLGEQTILDFLNGLHLT